jgi:hypothetical protein
MLLLALGKEVERRMRLRERGESCGLARVSGIAGEIKYIMQGKEKQGDQKQGDTERIKNSDLR